MSYTVLGAGGFIGRHLTASLRRAGHEVFAPERDQPLPRALGHVFYCIGLTADFRTRPFDTMRAHVCVLADVLEKSSFDSLVYLSSTRVYARSERGSEDALIPVDVADSSDLYNLSKLAGESLCQGRAKVVRLSNVVGHNPESPDFLSSLVREARAGRIELESHPESSKDYVLLDDVLAALPKVAAGPSWIYNLAGGVNLAHHQIVDRLAALTGCEVTVRQNAARSQFPNIDIRRAQAELGFAPAAVLDALPGLLRSES